MRVTIFTDASYYEKPRSGAWACIAQSPAGEFRYSCPIEEPRSSIAAEFEAVAMALQVVLPQRIAAQATDVVVFTDCQCVIGEVTRGRSKSHTSELVRIQQLLLKYRLGFQILHTPAHMGMGASPQHTWCDIQARRLAKRIWNRSIRELGDGI